LEGKYIIRGIIFMLLLGDRAMTQETTKSGVIVVDVQGDFTKFKNGSLAVEGTDEAYVKAVEEGTKKLKVAGFPIFATQDWHPSNHISFFTSHKGKRAFDVIKLRLKEQVIWPPHCVQKSPGAEILIDKRLLDAIVKKGTNPRFDSYSGFKDDGGKKTEMDTLLKKNKIGRLIIYVLATDYCVRATALDAAVLKYKVVLIKSLCRGVAPDTSQKAIEEMKSKGALILDDIDLRRIKGV
jgi:nicotinamidase/pyrazinamidase